MGSEQNQQQQAKAAAFTWKKIPVKDPSPRSLVLVSFV